MILAGGRVYAPGRPGATAVVIRGRHDQLRRGRRRRPAAPAGAAGESTSAGRLLTPAFVDAHLHAVQAGLVMTGLDLHGAASRTEVLERLAGYARRHPAATVIVGQGWDERGWPDPRPPDPGRAGPGGRWRAGLSGPGRRALRGGLQRGARRLPGAGRRGGLPDDGLTDPGRPPPVPRSDGPAVHRRGPRAASRRAAWSRPPAWAWPPCTSSAALTSGRWRTWTGSARSAAELGLGVVTYWGELASPAAIARARGRRRGAGRGPVHRRRDRLSDRRAGPAVRRRRHATVPAT